MMSRPSAEAPTRMDTRGRGLPTVRRLLWALLVFAGLNSGLGMAQPVTRLFALTDAEPFISYSWGEHWQVLRGELRGFEGSFDAMVCIGPQVFAGGADGLFESADYGETFRPVTRWEGASVRVIVAARQFVLEPTLLVGTDDGLFRSDDGGTSWTELASVTGRVRAIAWPGPEMFIATSEGLFVSNDKADSAQRIRAELPETEILTIAVSRYFAADPVLFVGTEGDGLYRSDDGGRRFRPLGDGELGLRRIRALWWWNDLLLVGTDTGLYLSKDSGERFEEASITGIPQSSINAISVPAAGGLFAEIFIGTDYGVLKSADGGQSFRRTNEGLVRLRVLGFASFPFSEASPARR